MVERGEEGIVNHGDGTKQYECKVTSYVIVTCFIAAMGGFLFGYDAGITGGVTSMKPFLIKFFPILYRQMKNQDLGFEDPYCQFDNQLLTLYISSLYLAALVASFFAYITTRMMGCNLSILFGGLFFFVGGLLNGFAINLHMLIIGRVLLGFGVGFCHQAIPLYISEMAPTKLRGSLNLGFQMMLVIGILIANVINYLTSKYENGWRISLGGAVVPAVILCLGCLKLGDTPNSLILRGKQEEGKAMLVKIRGTHNIEEEFKDLVNASEVAKMVKRPWIAVFELKYRPQLTFCSFIPFFQQFTGINVIILYAPLIFKTLNFGEDAALMSAAITGGVNVLATIACIFCVDRYGRRLLFLQGGAQMFICEIAIGVIIGLNFGVDEPGEMSKSQTNVALVFICAYVAAFACSWGPLGWLVPSEICSLETRSVGQSINVAVNMLFTFAINQVFLTMLCYFKFCIFFFFAGFLVIMTIFIALFLPETNNVPIEQMNTLWTTHWFWNKFIPNDYEHVNIVDYHLRNGIPT